MRKAMIIVAAVAGLAASVASAASLAVMPVKFLDTSGEIEDQTSDHAARLEAMGRALQRDLAADYDSVVLIQAEAMAERCPDETPDCLVDLARETGADTALFAVVVKTSTLIMRLYVNVIDLTGGQILARRELNFRGDTDESWERAEQFLVRNLRAR